MNKHFTLRIALFVLCLLYGSLPLSAQNPAIDSLNRLLKSEHGTHSQNYANLLFKMAEQYSLIQPDSAIYYIDLAINESRDRNEKSMLAKSLWLKSKVLIDLARYADARKALDESERIYAGLRDYVGLADVQNLMGNIYKKQNKYEEAQKQYKKALKTAETAGDNENLAGIYINIGITYDYAGNYPKAIECYLKALRYFEKTGNKNSMAMTLNNISIVHFYNGDMKEAISNAIKANNLYRESGDKVKLCRGVTNLGEIYAETDSFSLARKCFDEATALVKIVKDPRQEAYILGAYAKLLSDQGQLEASVSKYEEKIKLMKAIDADGDIAIAEMDLGKLFVKMKLYDKSIPLLTSAMPRLEGDLQSLRICKEALASAYAGKGDYQNAYILQKEQEILKDSILNKDKNLALQTLEAKYESEKKAKLIAEQNAVIMSHRYQLYLLLGGLLGLGVISYLLYRRNQQTKAYSLVLHQQNEQLIQANGEMKQLLEKASKQKIPLEELKNIPLTLSNQDKNVLKLGDIIYLEANGNFVTFYTTNGNFHDWQQMSHYEKLLNESGLFIRTHRSYLVNWLHIAARKTTELAMSNGEVVAISTTSSTKAVVNGRLDEIFNGKSA